MTTLRGKPITGGRGEGRAIVTRTPINFTAAFMKPANLLPRRRAEIRDEHHDLLGTRVDGSVLVFPSCVGSTYSGMMILKLVEQGAAPAAIVVQEADTLLVSGAVMAEVWFGKKLPVVEYPGDDIFDAIASDSMITVDGDTGEISIPSGS